MNVQAKMSARGMSKSARLKRQPGKMRKGERDAQRDMVANASCSTMPKSSMSDEYDVVVMPPPT